MYRYFTTGFGSLLQMQLDRAVVILSSYLMWWQPDITDPYGVFIYDQIYNIIGTWDGAVIEINYIKQNHYCPQLK